MSDHRVMMEAAIAANFADSAAHAAYADLLIEEGVDQGEFIRIQLALEDETLSSAARKEWIAREKDWLFQHRAEYLGAFGDTVFADETIDFGFSRGWLTSLRVPRLNRELAQQIRDCPAARMLQSLVVDHVDSRDPEAAADEPIVTRRTPLLAPWVDAPWCSSLRTFHFGVRPERDEPETADASPAEYPPPSDYLVPVLNAFDRLAHLRLWADNIPFEPIFSMRWAHLQSLEIDFGYSIPLAVLADNESLRSLRKLKFDPDYRGQSAFSLEDVRSLSRASYLPNLRHLQLRHSDLGDRLIRTLLRGSLLRRLRILDLRHGNVTDAGVKSLLESDSARRLQSIDLAYNLISDEGLIHLNDLACEVMAYPQSHRRDRTGDAEDLYEDEFE